MKIIKKTIFVLLTLLTCLIGYGLYIFSIAGEFEKLKPHFAGNCQEITGLPGTEDITIDLEEGIAYISSDDRRTIPHSTGAIFAYNLNRNGAEPYQISPDSDGSFHPHGISLYKDEDGRATLFVINHPRGIAIAPESQQHLDMSLPESRIEIFDIVRGKLVLRKQVVNDQYLLSPNDIHAIDHDRFYFTNDHGTANPDTRALHDYLRINRAQVVYYNGESFKTVVHNLGFANGINGNTDDSLIYVAETTGNRLNIYKRNASSGDLAKSSSLTIRSGLDNIEIDSAQNLWIGSHPQLLTFIDHANGKKEHSPSQVFKIPQASITALQSGASDDATKNLLKEVYLSDGKDISASSVAAVWQDRMIIGAVFDAKFLDCTLPAASASSASPVEKAAQ